MVRSVASAADSFVGSEGTVRLTWQSDTVIIDVLSGVLL